MVEYVTEFAKKIFIYRSHDDCVRKSSITDILMYDEEGWRFGKDVSLTGIRQMNIDLLVLHEVLNNNQINARALIGQSAVGFCAGKPTEKSCVCYIII